LPGSRFPAPAKSCPVGAVDPARFAAADGVRAPFDLRTSSLPFASPATFQRAQVVPALFGEARQFAEARLVAVTPAMFARARFATVISLVQSNLTPSAWAQRSDFA